MTTEYQPTTKFSFKCAVSRAFQLTNLPLLRGERVSINKIADAVSVSLDINCSHNPSPWIINKGVDAVMARLSPDLREMVGA